VDVVEIFAYNDAGCFCFSGYDIQQLHINFVPQEFGIATQERHVDFIMNVADFVKIGLFVECHTYFFFVFQIRGTVFTNAFQHLRIFSYSTGTIENNIFQIGDFGGKFMKDFVDFGMQIDFFTGLQIFFKMSLHEFHLSFIYL
jgi:hypothetical protein